LKEIGSRSKVKEKWGKLTDDALDVLSGKKDQLIGKIQGKGEGSLIGLAKVSFDKKNPDNLDIENFGTYPAKLMGVELRSR
jgi:hypothetical protein